MQRRADAGALIEKWLEAAKHNPIAKKQILKFIEKTSKHRPERRDMLSELRKRGRIILSGVV